uniref:hypothetical protein n=1 Tax=Escherichia coli TaxID=562 RepID=UPI0021CCE911|nr:hypothetical protein [Escherichia coli]
MIEVFQKPLKYQQYQSSDIAGSLHRCGNKGGKSHGTRPALPHSLAIKGVKCHGTRPAFLHGLAIKGVKCHGTRPASPWPGD